MTDQPTLQTFTPTSIRRTYSFARVVAGPVETIYRLFGRWADITPHNIPAHGPAILAVYHASLLDPLFVALSLWRNGRMPHFLAKSPLFKGPLGTPLRSLGQIPVFRNSSSATDSLIAAKECLAAGECVVIYPQGTLTKNPDLWPEHFRSGTVRLAFETGAPIIPVAHWGTHLLMPPGAKRPKIKPGNIVQIAYGEPISVAGIEPSRGNITKLTRYVEAVVANGVAKLRGVPLPQKYRAALEAAI